MAEDKLSLVELGRLMLSVERRIEELQEPSEVKSRTELREKMIVDYRELLNKLTRMYNRS